MGQHWRQLALSLLSDLSNSAASPLDVWRLWFASCLLGTVTVAPLLIGLGEAVREPPPRRELIEGAVGVVTLAALSIFVISLPQGPWATALPVALVFPILLWVAVRCRPVFAAGATFVVALAVIWSATFDMGHFGDPSIPVADRILAAQTLVLAGALLALLLAALFAERRQNESTLKMSNERLKVDISERKKAELALAERNIQLALAGKAALVGSYAYDTDTEIMQISEGYAAIHGFSEGTAEIGRSECLLACTVVSAQVQSSPNVMPAPLASEARERDQAGTEDTGTRWRRGLGPVSST